MLNPADVTVICRIRESAIRDTIEHARRASPRESCGILLSSDDAIVALEELTNLSALRDRFEIDPLQLARSELRARRTGLRLAGFYHSHVSADVAPSPADREGILWPDLPPFLHMIVSPDGRWAMYNTRDGAWTRVDADVEP